MEHYFPKTYRKQKSSKFFEKLFAGLFLLNILTAAPNTVSMHIGLSLPTTHSMTLSMIRIQNAIVAKTKHA